MSVENTPVTGAGRSRKEPIPPTARKAAVAGVVGSFIEYYDWMLFGVLTVYLAPLFFPSEDPAASILAGLAAFGVGYLAKPVGAVVFGRIGDRHGRRTALMATVLLMGTCTTLIALLPVHASIGVTATVLLVVLRLGQGMSSGAELQGAITYVLESAPPSRRGFLASLVQVGSGLGTVVGSGSAAVLGLTLTQQQMLDFGWRIPFLIAAPLTLIAFLLRRTLEDTPEFRELVDKNEVVRAPVRDAVVANRRPMVLACLFAFAHAGFSSLTVWMTPHLSGIRGLPAGEVFLAFAIGASVAVVMAPISGRALDRFGHRRVILVGATAGLIAAPLVLWLIGTATSVWALSCAVALYMSLVWFLAPPIFQYQAELFPTNVRFTGATIAWNVGNISAGGTGPLIASALVISTGSVFGPLFWVGGAGLLFFVAIFATRTILRGEQDLKLDPEYTRVP